MCAIRCQHGPTLQFVSCAAKKGFLEQSWWPEFDMFGSMPWWSFPWHKLLLRLTPKNCYTVYSLNLIDEFTSLLSPKVSFAGLPRENFPTEACLCGHQSLRKQQPRFAQGQPKKEFHRTSKAIADMNADWKVEKAQYAEFNVPTCGKFAVWQLCRESKAFWNSHDGLNLTCLDQCHGVRWRTPENCDKVYSLNLIDEFTSLFSLKVIVAGLPRESFPHAFVDISVILWLCTKILPRLAQGLFSNERTW